MEHTHHWMLDEFPVDKQYHGVCRDCGEEQKFPASTYDTAKWDRHVTPQIDTINYVSNPRRRR